MTPEYIIVHTVAKKGKTSKEEITRWHIEDNGWRDFGYHYYILKDGTVQKGRADNVPGAHCPQEGMNRRSLGICFEGHGNYEPWTREQRTSFEELYKELRKAFDIPSSKVIGHREVKGVAKDCPGTLIDMDNVRNYLSTRFEGMV